MLSPKTWKMNDADGKSDLANAQWKGDAFMVGTIDEGDYEDNKKAADACPVSIIRLD
jgi:ferredoxin